MIKDSGQRTEFGTGAVRDMAEGKGRFDLMPLDVMGNIMCDTFIDVIGKYIEERDINYLYKAVDLAIEKIYFNSRPKAMLEVAKHFEEGAEKYGEDNWKKGIPVNSYIDSGIRHYIKWLDGWDDEPHDRAVLWNLMCCIWTINHGGESE